MKNQLVITIALAAAFSTGCDLKLQDQLGGEEQPEVEQPIDRERPPMEGGVEPPTGEGEPPVDPPEHGEDGIEHPIEEVEPPLDAPEDGGDALEGFDVDDPEGGDVNGGGHPGAHGDDEETKTKENGFSVRRRPSASARVGHLRGDLRAELL